LARKPERAVEALYAEIQKLDPVPRAAIMARLEAVRGELRTTFSGLIKPGASSATFPDWFGAPPVRRRRGKR
jgi:hypothetical protein